MPKLWPKTPSFVRLVDGLRWIKKVLGWKDSLGQGGDATRFSVRAWWDEPDEATRGWRQQRDIEQSEKSKLPPNEEVRLRCLWVLEAYPPSGFSELRSAFEKFGWAEQLPFDSNANITVQISRARRRLAGGGWSNLGIILPDDSRSTIGWRRVAELPDGVRHIRGTALFPTPTMTLLCWHFVFDEKSAASLEEPLRADFTTEYEPLPGGAARVYSPPSRRSHVVGSIRQEMYRDCYKFVEKHFPGVFANGLLDGEFPTCELLTLKNVIPYEARPERDTYLSVLGLWNPYDVWISDKLSGLFLEAPWTGELDFASLFLVGRLQDILADEKLGSYGRNHAEAVVNWLSCLDFSLGAWALWVLVNAYHRRISELRDEVASQRLAVMPLAELEELCQRIFYSTADAVPFSRDLEKFTADHWAFREVFEFQRLKPLSDSGETRGFFDWIRQDLAEKAVDLRDRDQQLRAALSSASELVRARSNQQVASDMLRAQRWALVLTWALLALTAALLIREFLFARP